MRKDAERTRPEPRSEYRWFRDTSPQWRDNDVYGHVNNAVHHTWFDSAVNGWLLEQGGLVVANSCQYFGEVAFPERVQCGLRVARIGSSSVTYELGLFRNEEPRSFAAGSLTHVYVRWPSRVPSALSAPARMVLSGLIVT
jgi:acyl-CoA thioester hydrolase